VDRLSWDSGTTRELIRMALAEDIGTGDVTTQALVPPGAGTEARIVARGACVAAGTGVAAAVFREVDATLTCRIDAADGTGVAAGEVVMGVRGEAAGILTAERTALNFLQRLTGIATLTRRFVETVRPYGVTVLDTRKTTPGWRMLEKYAVRCGGGVNHRFGLHDRILIKDNHRRLWTGDTGRTLGEAVAEARRRFPGLVIEVEVENEDELKSVLETRPDWILLDNMEPDRIRRCADICRGRSRIEASGGITLETVAATAAAGIDAVSLGCLTHSAPAADLSLEFT
jgi:nicotinate-nucleotide pyrophosphorylase (carboxylating)